MGSRIYFLGEVIFQQTVVKKDTDRLPVEDSLAIKTRLVGMLEERGMSAAELVRRIGMTGGGWHKMWNNGTLTAGRLAAISKAMQVPVSAILGEAAPTNIAADPQASYGKHPYIEQRIERLEVELRKLREQVRALQH